MMPNWCNNNVKISANGDKDLQDRLRQALAEDNKQDLFCQFVPQPKFETEDSWYGWNIANWGTKWDASPHNVIWEDDGTVKFGLETAWAPPVGFYEKMEELGYTVDAYYLEEGMAFVGRYYNGFDDYYEYGGMSADEIEEQIPSDINETFYLSDYQRDREQEEEEEDDTELNTIEKTDWYTKDIDPVREGLYETLTGAWPFPQMSLWNGKKWLNKDADTDEYTVKAKIDKWRGITEAQHIGFMLDEALENIDDETT